MADESKPVEVSRRIEAPAPRIFKILANPQRHLDFDGSGMLRGAVLERPISNVGDRSELQCASWCAIRSRRQMAVGALLSILISPV
jgi:hypothetical protein